MPRVASVRRSNVLRRAWVGVLMTIAAGACGDGSDRPPPLGGETLDTAPCHRRGSRCDACCDDLFPGGAEAEGAPFSRCICDACGADDCAALCDSPPGPTKASCIRCAFDAVISGRCAGIPPDCEGDEVCEAWRSCRSCCNIIPNPCDR